MTRFPLNSRQLQQDFDEAWDACEQMLGRSLESDELEDLAETLLDE